MKKLAKLKLQNLSVLDARKMQELKGGGFSDFCFLRCPPIYQNGVSVDNCLEDTLKRYCDYTKLDEISCVC